MKNSQKPVSDAVFEDRDDILVPHPARQTPFFEESISAFAVVTAFGTENLDGHGTGTGTSPVLPKSGEI